MLINILAEKAHKNAADKGFWEEERSFAEQIALMHSELSEALEEYRDDKGFDIYYEAKENDKTKPCGIPIEFADTVIRILDTCAAYGIDLEKAIKVKMDYNTSREYKHGKKI